MAANTKLDVNVPLVMTIVVVCALFLLVTVIAVDGWYKSQEAGFVKAKWDESPNTWLDHLHQQERDDLAINHRINRQHRHVPVSEAMRIIADPKNQQNNATVRQIVHGSDSGNS